MNRRLQAGVFLAVALLAGAAGFLFNRGNLTAPVADGAAQRLALLSLPDIEGRPQALSQWGDRVVVVNFWATWCVPCREEIPELMKIQHKYASKGVQIVGIALDNVSNVRNYAHDMRINYVVLIGGMETLGITKDLGNRAGVLPFSVVLDRAGKQVFTHAGALTEAALGPVLIPLLPSGQL